MAEVPGKGEAVSPQGEAGETYEQHQHDADAAAKKAGVDPSTKSDDWRSGFYQGYISGQPLHGPARVSEPTQDEEEGWEFGQRLFKNEEKR